MHIHVPPCLPRSRLTTCNTIATVHSLIQISSDITPPKLPQAIRNCPLLLSEVSGIFTTAQPRLDGGPGEQGCWHHVMPRGSFHYLVLWAATALNPKPSSQKCFLMLVSNLTAASRRFFFGGWGLFSKARVLRDIDSARSRPHPQSHTDIQQIRSPSTFHVHVGHKYPNSTAANVSN